MEAVVYTEYGQLPALREVAEPVCQDGGVLLDVAATGVCRSDWHAWRGHDPVPLPNIPGHEAAGVVAAVGAGVRRWRVGDRVTVPFACGCGRCAWCAAGQAQVCPDQVQPGFTGQGTFAERVPIPAADTNLVALPPAVEFTAAASLGCRFATAYRAVTAHGRIAAGEWLVVHGCGGVGLSAVQIGVARGARVIAVDVTAAALQRAADLGAEHVVDAAAADPVAAVAGITGGGAHVSVDALGSAGTAAASVRCLRRRGRHVQVGLLFGAAATPPLPMDTVIAHELEIYGSHGMAAPDYPPMLDLVATGALRPQDLVGAVIDLAAAGRALAALDEAPAHAGMTVVAVGPAGTVAE